MTEEQLKLNSHKPIYSLEYDIYAYILRYGHEYDRQGNLYTKIVYKAVDKVHGHWEEHRACLKDIRLLDRIEELLYF